MLTLIKVFDEKEYLNNVIPPLSLKVSTIIFLYHHNQDRNQITNTEKVLKRYGDFKLHFYQLNDDEKEIEELIKNHSKFIVDISANRYLTMLLFEKALKYNRPIVYYDSYENVIKDYRKHKIIVKDVFSLKIEDLINLAGGELKHHMHEAPGEDDRNSEALIKDVVEASIDNYASFISYIQKVNHIYSKNKDSNYISDEEVSKIKSDPLFHKYQSFNIFNFHDNKISFYSPKIKEMFKVSGSWLESYLYLIFKESKKFDEVMMSVVIDFSENDQSHYPIMCEVDGIVLRSNRLAFISSKSNKVETDALNEIKTHQERFGNQLSHPVICTVEELSDKNPSIYLKAQGLKIAVLERQHFKNQSLVKIMNKILNNTYIYVNKL